MNYTVKDIRKGGVIIFEAKMGSHAYGTNIPTSDVDLRGVFIQPLEDVLKYGYKDQVADKTNDIVFYELKRFLELVKKNNPNILELLNAPEDCIIHKHPIYDLILEQSRHFVTKRCRHTFAGYAIEQIRKARGYNKKMNWEEASMVRKNVLDFCYILKGPGTISLNEWLKTYNAVHVDEFDQRDFALAKVDHAHDVYALYKMPNRVDGGGIVKDPETSNDVQLTSIPKAVAELSFMGHLTFNKDAYSTHCKRYREYQVWLNERNEDRFKMNKDHGKNYDSKNMMHTFRLLKMAIEIAETGEINVRRSDEERKKLMKIRHGEYEYDNLIEEAEALIEQLDEKFDASILPDKIYDEFVANLELDIRKRWYKF